MVPIMTCRIISRKMLCILKVFLLTTLRLKSRQLNPVYLMDNVNVLSGIAQCVLDVHACSIYSPYATVDVVASTSRKLSDLEGSMKKFRNKRFSLDECLPPMLFDEAEEAADPGRIFHDEHQTDGGELKSPSRKIGDVVERAECVRSFDEEDAGLEQIMFCELTVGESEKAKEAADPGRTFHKENQENVEEVQSPHSPMIGDDAEPEEYVKSLDKEHANMEQTNFSDFTALESQKIQITGQKCPVSVSVNVTPEHKAPEATGAY